MTEVWPFLWKTHGQSTGWDLDTSTHIAVWRRWAASHIHHTSPIRTVPITPDTACKADEASSSISSYDVVCMLCCVTIRLHRVNYKPFQRDGEIISHFKDPALLKRPLKYTYIVEKEANAAGWLKICVLPFEQSVWTNRLEGRTWGFHHCHLNGRKQSENPSAWIVLKGFQDHAYFPCGLSPIFKVGERCTQKVDPEKMTLIASHLAQIAKCPVNVW